MGVRFRKKIKLSDGLAININKSTFTGKGSGASMTVGKAGCGMNLNKDGVEGFVGIPGTGLGYRTKRFGRSKTKKKGLTFYDIISTIALIFVIYMWTNS